VKPAHFNAPKTTEAGENHRCGKGESIDAGAHDHLDRDTDLSRRQEGRQSPLRGDQEPARRPFDCGYLNTLRGEKA